MQKVLVIGDDKIVDSKKEDWIKKEWDVNFLLFTSMKDIVKTIETVDPCIVFVRNNYSEGVRGINIIDNIRPRKEGCLSIVPFCPNISWIYVSR